MAAQLNAQCRQDVQALGDGETLLISGAGLADVTGPVAREIGPNLVAEFERRGAAGRFLLYKELSPELRYSLHVCLSTSGFAVRAAAGRLESGEYVLLGHLPAALAEVIEQIYARGTRGVSSSELQTAQIQAASRKLHALHARWPWLLRAGREATAPGERTWHYRYWPPLA